MFRRFSVNFALFSITLDAVLVCTALVVATRLRPLMGFLPFAADFPEVIPTPWPIYPIFAFEWVAIMLQFSVYDGRRNLRGVEEFTRVTLASILASVAMAGTLYLSFRDVSRLLFIIFVILAYLSMLAWRAFVRLRLNPARDKTRPRRQVLIVGAGPVGRELQKKIQANPQLGLNVAGFLDDNPQKRSNQPDILGSLDSIGSLIQKQHIEDVVIALPQRAYKRTNRLIGELHRLPVKVWVIPDYFRLALHKAAVEEFAGIPMLDMRAPALSDGQRLVKRAFDLFLTICTLLVALPVMGIIALAIRLEGPGPVIFRQLRV
jgi:FlaA1/EpsC-like NDP-sugar epimerase